MKLISLDNGTKVFAERMAEKECVSINLGMLVGSAHESENEAGLAHFIEHIMFNGTQKDGKRSLMDRFEQLGGKINARTDNDSTCYELDILKENLDESLKVFSEMMMSEVTSLHDIEFEKSIVMDEIRGRGEGSVFWQGFFSAAYGDHPICRSIIGTEEEISSIDAYRVMEFQQRHYVGNNCAIAICGDVEEEKCVDLVEKYFGTFRPGEPSSFPALNYQGGEVQFPCSCAHGRIALAFPLAKVDEPDGFVGEVLSKLICEGPNSYLFKEIRERRGMAYDVNGWTGELCGGKLMVINVDGDSTKNIEIFDAMTDIVANVLAGIGEQEAENAKKNLVAEYRIYRDYMSSRTESAINEIAQTGGVIPFLEKMEIIRAITPADVFRVAQSVLTSPPTLAVHGKIGKMPKIDILTSKTGQLRAA